ncbi:hypothetical protein [Phenylobacterium sp.]|uniref:hypothetical protein n=1 Tax=Phenylobacterium sp. TaxID=1871053 RepID=UPI0025ED5842|nr:hypothetical protein [Phenylobacterium sp.]
MTRAATITERPMPAAATSSPTIDVAAAVNSRGVLANCLQRSPDIASGALTLRTYEACRSASQAYNRALADTAADVLVLAHQDVYLPAGFLEHARAELRRLDALQPSWALAGVTGLDAQKVFHGRTWSSGLGQLLGERPAAPVAVETLDEMLIFVRCASGLRFDEDLPGFHLYAADAVQIARARGLGSYVIDAPAIHHSRAVVALDGGYRKAYRYMQRKWRAQLPIPNLVCPITRSPLTLLLRDLRIRRKHRGKARPTEPTDDPSAIAVRLGFEAPA